jgi:hypothetical protein
MKTLMVVLVLLCVCCGVAFASETITERANHEGNEISRNGF